MKASTVVLFFGIVAAMAAMQVIAPTSTPPPKAYTPTPQSKPHTPAKPPGRTEYDTADDTSSGGRGLGGGGGRVLAQEAKRSAGDIWVGVGLFGMVLLSIAAIMLLLWNLEKQKRNGQKEDIPISIALGSANAY